jgi:HD-like signal output (HDOD) protein
VNSPFYGLRTRASSVAQAISLLGLNNVERLVTGLLLREAFSGAAGKAMEDFWEASSRMAQITAWLAPRVKIVNHDEAYTFALFRDCGMAALLGTFKNYKPVMYGAATAHPQDMLATEQQQFGVDHVALGYRMATNWLLPDATCDAVRHHHHHEGLMNGAIDIPELSVGLISVALAAEWIYTMHTDGKECQGWNNAGDFVLAKLGITASQLETFQREAESVLTS